MQSESAKEAYKRRMAAERQANAERMRDRHPAQQLAVALLCMSACIVIVLVAAFLRHH